MARIIDNLDPWANVWEDVGKSFGSGLMTGWEKGKQQKEIEELGLDFSTPEKSLESGYKLVQYNLSNNNIPEARQWYNIIADAEAARTTKKGGSGSPASASALGGTVSGVKKWMEDVTTEESEGNWFFNKNFAKGSQEKIERAFAKLQGLGLKDAQISSTLRSFLTEKGSIDPDLVFDEDAFNRALAAQTGGTMQQPSGGGSALMGTAPPVPSIFKR